MIEVDGSAGGGQLLRTALSLSLCTLTPYRMRGSRAGRERPGLMRQHLTAVEPATRIGNAQVSGAMPMRVAASTAVRCWRIRPGRERPAAGSCCAPR